MNISLTEFVDPKFICSQSFEYAGITGSVDLIGWNILFFTSDNKTSTSAVSLDEITVGGELADVSNQILSALQIELHIGSKFDQVKQLYGKELKKDELYEDSIRYYYLNANVMLCFSIHQENGLIGFEMIDDPEIIELLFNTPAI